MKIATWNVNSLRVRLPQLRDWLGAEQPDLMGLQETKVVDAEFPRFDIESLCTLFTACDKLQRFAEMIIDIGDRGERGDPIAALKDLIKEINYEAWLSDSSASEKTAKRRMENVWELVTWMQRVQEQATEDKTLSDLVRHM